MDHVWIQYGKYAYSSYSYLALSSPKRAWGRGEDSRCSSLALNWVHTCMVLILSGFYLVLVALKLMWLYLGKPGIRYKHANRAMHMFSTSGKNYESRKFVISMSKNPSKCCRHLWRLAVSYKGEISHYFDLPSLYSCHTRSPLLRAIILHTGYLITVDFLVPILHTCMLVRYMDGAMQPAQGNLDRLQGFMS